MAFIKIGTVLLGIVAIQMCMIYIAINDAVSGLIRDDFMLVNGSNDVYIFRVILTFVSILQTVLLFTLAILILLGFTHYTKSFIIMVLAFNFIIIAPFYVSGINLYFTVAQELKTMNPKLVRDFLTVQNNVNATVNDTNVANVAQRISKIQLNYCCCGLNQQEDYSTANGFFFNTTVMFSDFEFSCPSRINHPKSHCVADHFEGCSKRILQTQENEIIVCTLTGLVCSIIQILITPLLYSIFEKRRRQARCKYITAWQRELTKNIQKEMHQDNLSESSKRLRKTTKEKKSRESQRSVNDADPLLPNGQAEPSQSSLDNTQEPSTVSKTME